MNRKLTGNTANGATRAAKYSDYWQESNLDDAINKFAPDSTPVTTNTGKTIYRNDIKEYKLSMIRVETILE